MSLMMLRPCQKFNAISNLKNPNHNVLAFTGKSICEMQWYEVTASSEIFLTHGLWLWSRGADCINPRILRTSRYRKAAQWLKNNSADIVWKNVPASLCKSFEWGIFSSDADLSGWAVVHTATTKVLVYYFFPSVKSCWSAMGLRSSYAKKWCDWKQSISNSRDTNRWHVFMERSGSPEAFQDLFGRSREGTQTVSTGQCHLLFMQTGNQICWCLKAKVL